MDKMLEKEPWKWKRIPGQDTTADFSDSGLRRVEAGDF